MAMYLYSILIFLLSITWGHSLLNDIEQDSPIPVVIWHGMGDSCCNPMSMGSIKSFLEQNIPNVYVRSLEIGNNMIEDVENGFFMAVNKQIEMVCDKLSNDTKLKNGYNAIGFSQGGQFLRAVAQRCPTPPMLNLISFGGQHQGVYGIPHCFGDNSTICNIVRKLLNFGAYVSWIQNYLVQAQYWHDPLNEGEYRNKSAFLAEINNENTINTDYRTNLMKLKNIVFVKFTLDTMVDPVDSEWFGFYKPGQAKEINSLQDSPLYKEDRLGLQKMDKLKKLHFLEIVGDHLHISLDWFLSNIINKFLK